MPHYYKYKNLSIHSDVFANLYDVIDVPRRFVDTTNVDVIVSIVPLALPNFCVDASKDWIQM